MLQQQFEVLFPGATGVEREALRLRQAAYHCAVNVLTRANRLKVASESDPIDPRLATSLQFQVVAAIAIFANVLNEVYEVLLQEGLPADPGSVALLKRLPRRTSRADLDINFVNGIVVIAPAISVDWQQESSYLTTTDLKYIFSKLVETDLLPLIREEYRRGNPGI